MAPAEDREDVPLPGALNRSGLAPLAFPPPFFPHLREPSRDGAVAKAAGTLWHTPPHVQGEPSEEWYSGEAAS